MKKKKNAIDKKQTFFLSFSGFLDLLVLEIEWNPNAKERV